MALSVTHSFTSAIADDPTAAAAGEVLPSHWNAAHTLTGQVDLTTQVTGTLPVGNGGTGITALGTGVATFLGAPSSANLAAALTDETGTGAAVFATSPTLVTPVLGTPTSGTLTNCTGLSLTAGVTGILPAANGGTANGFTAFSGPATSTKTFTLPNSSQTLLCSDLVDQTISGGANVTSATLTTGNITVDCGKCPLQYITNGGAFTITAPTSDGSCMLLVTNNGTAGAITFSGFSVGSNTGDALTTTNTSKFTISIWRINGTSGYRIAAHQ